MVIADLTYDNANVFYELALRHSFEKPAILIKEENERIPFDIRDMRIIPVDFKFIDSMEKCKNEIINQIKELEINQDKEITPVTFIQKARELEEKIKKLQDKTTKSSSVVGVKSRSEQKDIKLKEIQESVREELRNDLSK